MKKQWFNIGKGAFRSGLKLAAVLTTRKEIDELISAGYAAAQRKAERRLARGSKKVLTTMTKFIAGEISEKKVSKRLRKAVEA